jgi:hypothetical protein
MKHLKHLTLILVAAVAVLAAACSKEETGPSYSESMVMGKWKFPVNTELSKANLANTFLTIDTAHKAYMNGVNFNYWKLEGTELTLTRDVVEGTRHELGVFKATIADLNDSTMTLVGTYRHAWDTTVDAFIVINGLYEKDRSVVIR